MCQGQVRLYSISFVVIHPLPWKTLQGVYINPNEHGLATDKKIAGNYDEDQPILKNAPKEKQQNFL